MSMSESLTIAEGNYKTQFKLYWSKTHASLTLCIEENDDIREHILIDASSVVLREIANQLYDWSDTLEQNEHDVMDEAMAKMSKRQIVNKGE